MKRLICIILVFTFAFSDGFGWVNKSDSKYDSAVSKYDIGMSSFRFKYNEGTNRCEEVSIKEREAIVTDIKSGRFKIKKHPELKGLLFVSGNFSSDKEYAYYMDVSTCVKHNMDHMINYINSTHIPYRSEQGNY